MNIKQETPSNEEAQTFRSFHDNVLQLMGAPPLAMVSLLQRYNFLSRQPLCKTCGTEMKLEAESRTADKHVWVCRNDECTVVGTTRSLRSFSLFEPMPKSLNMDDLLKIILLWCEKADIEKIILDSDHSKSKARQIFNQCNRVAESHIRKWESENREKMGAPHESPHRLGLVIMDLYPRGYMRLCSPNQPTNTFMRHKHESTFLCFAEVQWGKTPPIWVYQVRASCTVQEMVALAKQRIHPQAILVTNRVVAPSSRFRQQGMRAVDVEDLAKMDSPHSHFKFFLEAMWNELIPELEKTRGLSIQKTEYALAPYLWHQRYGDTPAHALVNLLSHAKMVGERKEQDPRGAKKDATIKKESTVSDIKKESTDSAIKKEPTDSGIKKESTGPNANGDSIYVVPKEEPTSPGIKRDSTGAAKPWTNPVKVKCELKSPGTTMVTTSNLKFKGFRVWYGARNNIGSEGPGSEPL